MKSTAKYFKSLPLNGTICAMTKENLVGLIGPDATQNVTEMGGVMSKILDARNKVALGQLTLEEGLQVFGWAINKEAEIERMTEPNKWMQVHEDSMDGKLLRERGKPWFIEQVEMYTIK